MSIPGTRKEMLRAGYLFLNMNYCRTCKQPIEWWKTTRNARLAFVPNPDVTAAATLHRAVCPGTSATAVKQMQTAANRHKFRRQDVEQLLLRSGARIVVAIYDDGHAESRRLSIPAEDIRHELITAANQIRNRMEEQIS